MGWRGCCTTRVGSEPVFCDYGHGRDESRSNKTLYDHGQDVPNYGTSVGHERVLNPYSYKSERTIGAPYVLQMSRAIGFFPRSILLQ